MKITQHLLRLSVSILIVQLASAQNSTTSGCLIPGDADLFGVGIRIGLYFQIFSNFVIALVHPREAYDTFLPNLFFFVGILIALIYIAAQNSSPPGALIACTWFPPMMFTAFAPAMTAIGENSKRLYMMFRLLAYHIVVLSYLCINMWFWFKEVDAVDAQQCMAPRVFFFGNLSAYSGVRILFRLLSVLGAVITVLFIIFAIMGIRYQRTNPDRPLNSPSSIRCLKPVLTFIAEPAPSRILAVSYLGFVILAFELQFRWNHVDGINSLSSAGQIIPLTIGTMSLIQAIFSVIREIWHRIESVKATRAAAQNVYL